MTAHFKTQLIAAVMAGLSVTGCSDKKEAEPAKTETPAETKPDLTLSQGFYKPANDKAELLDYAHGQFNQIARLDKSTCVRVIDGQGEQETARVELPVEAAPDQRIGGFVRKTDLTPAPECEGLAKNFSDSAVNPPAPDSKEGYRLRSTAFLYPTIHGGKPTAQLLAGDCVKVEKVIQSEDQYRLIATISGRTVSGWAFDAKVDLDSACRLGL